MMNSKTHRKKIALSGTVLLHLLLLVGLCFISVAPVQKEKEEKGVLIAVDRQEIARMKRTHSVLQPVASAVEKRVPEKKVNQDKLLTQKEPSEVDHLQQQKKKDSILLALQQEERRKIAKMAAQRTSNAFNKAAKMERTTTDDLPEKEGDEGAEQAGSDGTTDLAARLNMDGRSLQGVLPMPLYTVQAEGRVVVSITVSPEGKVLYTSIHKETNTVNRALRDAAERAAKKTTFNRVKSVSNQIGTITYDFKLK